MVFVYPCITSENVNRQIVPAACKSMELFFLTQLRDSFNDGNITCVQRYDMKKKAYSAITFESTRVEDGGKLVTENAFDAVANVRLLMNESKILYKNDYTKPRFSASDNLKDLVEESLRLEKKLHTYRIKLESIMDSKDTDPEYKKLVENTLVQITKDIMTEHSFRIRLEAEDIPAKSHVPGMKDNSSKGGKKEKTPKEIYDEEYTKAKAKEQAKKDVQGKPELSSDNWKKAEDYKIDLTPTSMPLEVEVNRIDETGHAKVANKTISVGVTVIPIKIKNFNRIGDALLNDYFSRVSDHIFAHIYRSSARSILNGVRKFLSIVGLDRFLPDPGDIMHKNDIVKQMITMEPSNYVNASAFRSSGNAPANYRFTSSVVMFNKDDLDEDAEYVFGNRAHMNRLFKLGWTSFAVLDPVKEVMLFISSLDGGFLHELPYSYMFNALNASDIYKNESALRNGTRPFNIRKGNFAAFARSLSN